MRRTAVPWCGALPHLVPDDDYSAMGFIISPGRHASYIIHPDPTQHRLLQSPPS